MKSKGILALTLALVLLCTQMLPAFAAEPFTLTFYVPEGVAGLSYAKGDSSKTPTELTITDGTCTITGLTGADKLFIFPQLEEGFTFGSNAAVDRDRGKMFSFSDGYIYISYRALHDNMRVELVVENNSLHTLEDAPAYAGVSAVKTRDQWPWQVKDGALVPGNTGVNTSLSILLVDVDTDGLFAFEYRTSTEPRDCLLYHVNGELALDSDTAAVTSADNYAMRSDFSGRRSWSTAYVHVSAGDSVCLAYYKNVNDTGADVGEDTVWLRNLRVVSGPQSVAVYADSQLCGLESPGGSITISDNWKDGTVNVMETVNATATPKEGYLFMGWSRLVGNRWALHDTNAETSFYITGADTYRALFAQEDSFEAKNDGAYYTHLADALSDAQPGDLVVLLKDATLPEDAEVNSGVTLLIPFDREKTLYTIKPEAIMDDWKMPYPYCTLTLADGVTLTVSGELSLGSRISACGQEDGSHNGTPTGPYGAIVTGNDSCVQVANGGSLYAWGFISGAGCVEAFSGARVFECFQLGDFRGGSLSMDAFNAGSVPLIQYYVQNIETPLVMHAGAGETVCGAVSVTMDGDSKPSAQSASTVLIGPGGLFIPGEGGTVTKRYDAALDRIIFVADGDLTFSYMELRIAGLVKGTREYILPLGPNYSLRVHSGTTTVTQNTLLLPGTEVTVDAGATLLVAENTDVYVSSRGTASITIRPVSYTVAGHGARTWETTGDAVLSVSGVLEVRGGLYVTSDGSGSAKYAVINGTDGGMLRFTSVSANKTYAKYSPSGSTSVTRPVVSAARVLDTAAVAGCRFCWCLGAWRSAVEKDDFYELAIPGEGYVTRWVSVPSGEKPPTQVDLIATGNVNGDATQQVDITDLACLFAYLSAGERQGNLQEDPAYFDAVADVNSDGMVNILDYQALYQSFLLTSQ